VTSAKEAWVYPTKPTVKTHYETCELFLNTASVTHEQKKEFVGHLAKYRRNEIFGKVFGLYPIPVILTFLHLAKRK
jgi:ERCC4-related helicase